MSKDNSFRKAYEHLKSNSVLITKAFGDKGEKAEVYETNNRLVTIVELHKKEFWTKTRESLGDSVYESMIQELKGGINL